MGRAIICGSCVVDLPCLTVDLDRPIVPGSTHSIEPICPSLGGITCNTGIALHRLGVMVEPLTLVGIDTWGQLVRQQLLAEGIATSLIVDHPTAPTTAVVVIVDANGNRSFLAPNQQTATKYIDADFVRQQLSTIHAADYFILGYYGRMPLIEPNLPQLLSEIRQSGCRTVMDAAGDGGNADHLQRVLPQLDIYIPSETEAARQTECQNPEGMLMWFRRYNHHGILGVKLAEKGALLHCPDKGFIPLPGIRPPGRVVDTTGAGDCFLAGLIAGLDRGLSLTEAGHWATAAGALSVTARGGHDGIKDVAALQKILSQSDL